MLDLTKKQYRRISRALPRLSLNAIDYHIVQFRNNVFSEWMNRKYENDRSTRERDGHILRYYNDAENAIYKILNENYEVINHAVREEDIGTAAMISYIAMRMMYKEPDVTMLALKAYRRTENRLVP